MPDDYTSDFDSVFEDSGSVSRSEARKLARDEVQKTLSDINTFGAQAQAGVVNAIREISSVHPDFEEKRSKMLAVLEEIPLLKDAVSAAESNPQLAPTLPQMYEILYRASAIAGSAAASEPPKSDVSRPSDLSDEGTQYQAALASQRVDLSPANRKKLIAALEDKGIGDVQF